MCWINFKLNGHYPCFDFGWWLPTIQGDNKGNQMRYPIAHTSRVATLALGLWPRQGFARVRAKKEARTSHLMLLGM
jgi:hypothetical protein